MRKLFLCLIFACFAQAQQKPATQPAAQAEKQALSWCRLGADPVDAARKPDLGSECIVKISSATPVTMMTGSGRQIRCLLPPLTPVVVDRQSGVAKWVLACGNPLLSPANWVPTGTKICGSEQPVQPVTAAPAQAPAAPVTPAQPSPLEVKVGGEVRVVHGGEIRVVHESAPATTPVPETPAPAPTPQPKKGWWSRNAKWIVPVAIAAGAGSAVALTRGGGKTIQYQPLPPPLYRP
jgi:hypothetical protein